MDEPERSLRKLSDATPPRTVSSGECTRLLEHKGAEQATEMMLREGRLDESAVLTCATENVRWTKTIEGGPLRVKDEDVAAECAAKGGHVRVEAHTHPCGAAVPSLGDMNYLSDSKGNIDWFCVCRKADEKFKCNCIDGESTRKVDREELKSLSIEALSEDAELFPEEDVWETKIGGYYTSLLSESGAEHLEDLFRKGAEARGVKVKTVNIR